MAFEQRKLKFEAPKRTMKIDKHPFATNMVDVTKEKSPPQAKVLTSSSARKSGAVDPKAHITADEVKERIHRRMPNALRCHEDESHRRCC